MEACCSPKSKTPARWFYAVGGKGVQDLEQCDLDIGDGIERREVQLADFGAAAKAGALLGPLRFALVEVAELLAAKSGGTAGDTVGLGIITEGIRHECLLKAGYSLFAIRYSRKFKRQLMQAVGMPPARSNRCVRAGNLGWVTSAWLPCACWIEDVKRNRGKSGAVFPFWEKTEKKHGLTRI